jgi:excisionase family DNA binding protein
VPDPLLAHRALTKREQQATPMALLTIQDVAQWLTVKPCTLYAWVAQRKMPALKIHGVLRFRREDIDAWLAGCQIEPPNPSRPANRRSSAGDIDALIATAKREVYTPSRGEPDQDRAKPGGE